VSGVEWMVDVSGCPPDALQEPQRIVLLFERVVARMGLRPIGRPIWHQFPGTRGLTAVWMLQESHLTIHTFPEFGSANLNLFCCSIRPAPDWADLVGAPLGGSRVRVQECSRTYGDVGPVPPDSPA